MMLLNRLKRQVTRPFQPSVPKARRDARASDLYAAIEANVNREYAEAVCRFITQTKIKSVVDLDYGDFQIGKAIAATGVNYTGLGAAEQVVADHQRRRGRTGRQTIRFLLRDILTDELPDADLCLARGVFKYLSNADIQLMLMKMRKYKYAIVTDHQPPPMTFTPNLDLLTGPTVRFHFRIHNNSGLILNRPPFDVRMFSTFSINAPHTRSVTSTKDYAAF